MRRRCPSLHAAATVGAFAVAILAGCLFGSHPARADIDVRINIGNAPPPPRFVFVARPHERYFPEERIYVVDDPSVGDYDLLRYGGYYWVFSDGYWYRAPGWRGPFRVVHPRYVPTAFYRLPPAHWKHHPNGPPGLMKKGGMPPGQMRQGGDQGGGRPPVHMRQGDGGPPGQAKKGGGPPGQQKKGDKGDKGGDRGRK